MGGDGGDGKVDAWDEFSRLEVKEGKFVNVSIRLLCFLAFFLWYATTAVEIDQESLPEAIQEE